jgi:hypothetical protein
VILLGIGTAKRWPLTWPREYDLTLLPGDEPAVSLAPEASDGPVLVTVSYRVPAAEMEQFADLMRYVERHRRRTGAYRWGLFRDLGTPEVFVETFVVSSWAEHLRQHHRRTASSDAMLESVRRYIESGGINHYLSAYSDGGLAPHVLAGEQADSASFAEEV